MSKDAVIETATFSVGFGLTSDCVSGLLPVVECAILGIPTKVIISTGESDLLTKGLITAGEKLVGAQNDVVSPFEFEKLMHVLGMLYSSPLTVVEED
jgi:hypothetical protein